MLGCLGFAFEVDWGCAFAGDEPGAFDSRNIAGDSWVLNSGKASTVVPLTALYPLVTVLLAVAFLKEKVNRVQVGGIFLALVAIYFFNVPSEGNALNRWLLLAMIPIVLWGATGLLQKM